MVPSEHRASASEHLPGDVKIERRVAPPPTRTWQPDFGSRLIADLRGDPESLARAIVLTEILGPPVGLRGSGSRSFES